MRRIAINRVHDHHGHDTLLGWLLWALGSLIGFGQSYGMTLLSGACLVFGAWCQWRGVKLREREMALKEAAPR